MYFNKLSSAKNDILTLKFDIQILMYSYKIQLGVTYKITSKIGEDKLEAQDKTSEKSHRLNDIEFRVEKSPQASVQTSDGAPQYDAWKTPHPLAQHSDVIICSVAY